MVASLENLSNVANNRYYYYNEHSNNFTGDFTAVKTVEVDQRNIPFRYLQIDSFWYTKGSSGGVSNWTATATAFPGGLEALSNLTGFK
jgi:hypothetical protein